MEMLKIISNAAPRELARNSWNFSWDLTHGECDYKLLMYYLYNILQLREQSIQKFGDLQFDNLEAERIISDFGRDIISVIKKKFNAVEFSELSYLAIDNKPYHEFNETISNDTSLYSKFEKWLKDDISKDDLDELERKCVETQTQLKKN